MYTLTKNLSLACIVACRLCWVLPGVFFLLGVTHSCKAHAIGSHRCSMLSHTYNITANAPIAMPSIHATSQHQRQNCKTSITTHALRTRDDQPNPVVHISIPLMHRTDSSCIAQRWNAPLGLHPLSASMSGSHVHNAVHGRHRLLTHVPARVSANSTNRNAA